MDISTTLKILEGVLKTFDHKLKGRTSHSETAASKESVNQGNLEVKNQYEGLAIHQPSIEENEEITETLRNLNLSKQNSKLTKPNKKVKAAFKPQNKPVSSAEVETALQEMEYELVSDESDLQFVIYCFLQDVKKIRDYIAERWCDYKEGLISLTSISSATDVAFSMFQRAEREVQLQLPRGTVLDAYESVMSEFFGVNLYDIMYSQQKAFGLSYSGPNQEIYEKSDDAAFSVYQQLQSFLRYYPVGKTPIHRCPDKDYQGKDTYGTCPEAKMLRNFSVLNQFIMEMALHRYGKKCGMLILIEDELQCGILEMLESRKISMWLVFACQVFLDIRYILEADVDRAHAELVDVGKRLSKTINEFLTISPENQPPGVLDAMRQTRLEMNTWCTHDYIGQALRNRLLLESGNQAESWFLLRRHPVLCGLLILRFSLAVMDYGLKISNYRSATVTAAHLYNAAVHEIPSTPAWLDMDALIAVHDENYLFVGPRPTNTHKYWGRYELAKGTSIKYFSSTPEGRLIKEDLLFRKKTSKPNRALFPECHVSNLLRKRIRGTRTYHSNSSTIADIEALLQCDFTKQGRSLDPGFGIDPIQVIPDHYSHQSAFSNRQYRNLQTLTSIQVLVHFPPQP